MSFVSGFIAIIGPPNVGKSTLLNRILGEKTAIVSPKPQTTRNRILGIYHGDDFQMVFMDTPGIHRTITALHKSMVASAFAAFTEVDILIVMMEMQHPNDLTKSPIITRLKEVKKPCFLVINKIDKGQKEQLLPLIADAEKFPFDAVHPISALTGDGVEGLLEGLKARLQPGPEFFPKEMTTDQSESFLISEMIREKVFLHVKDELPYSTAVTLEHLEEVPERGLLSISAKIHVEKNSQKGILIGKGGSMIKSIGQSARRELEKRFGLRIYLDLMVRVEKNWSKNPRALRNLGY